MSHKLTPFLGALGQLRRCRKGVARRVMQAHLLPDTTPLRTALPRALDRRRRTGQRRM